MDVTPRRWLPALLLAVAAPPAAALDPPAEPVLLRAQRHFEALRAEDCAAQLAPAIAFTNTAEFATGLESQQRVAFLWGLAACAMNSGEFEAAFDAAGRLLALDPALPLAHGIRFYAGMILGRNEAAVESLLAVARSSPELLRALEVEHVARLLRAAGDLDLTGDRQLQVHEAIVAAGFTPPPPDTDEFLRVGHARLLLERGRIDEARARLAPVGDVDFLVAMRIERLFDPLREDPQFEARLDLAAAMERNLARSKSAIAQNPRLLQSVYQHVQNLDKARREAEAVALAEDALARLRRDPAAFSDAGRFEPWVLNELGYLLYELGRADEGARVLRDSARLAERGGQNVSQVINFASYLVREGRGAEALALLEQAGPASPYGRAWIQSLRSCIGVLTGDEALRVQGLEYLHAHVADNPPALSRALLCSDDVDGAAALMIRRLGNRDWRSAAILALQRVPRTGMDELEFQKLLTERFDRLRGREDVLQALEPVGRIETIPLDVGGGN
ncbi:MAG: hypothetical protein KF822_05460 [Steroidobacteraceae bacterium]|nr:hypothetical protein [Steroidobacteraceae bacterium]